MVWPSAGKLETAISCRMPCGRAAPRSAGGYRGTYARRTHHVEFPGDEELSIITTDPAVMRSGVVLVAVLLSEGKNTAGVSSLKGFRSALLASSVVRDRHGNDLFTRGLGPGVGGVFEISLSPQSTPQQSPWAHRTQPLMPFPSSGSRIGSCYFI